MKKRGKQITLFSRKGLTSSCRFAFACLRTIAFWSSPWTCFSCFLWSLRYLWYHTFIVSINLRHPDKRIELIQRKKNWCNLTGFNFGSTWKELRRCWLKIKIEDGKILPPKGDYSGIIKISKIKFTSCATSTYFNCELISICPQKHQALTFSVSVTWWKTRKLFIDLWSKKTVVCW